MESLSSIVVNDYIFSVIVLAAGLAAGLVAYGVVLFILRRWLKSLSQRVLGIGPAHLIKPLRSLLPSLFLLIASVFMRIPEGLSGAVTHLFKLWFIGSCGWLVTGLLRTFRDGLLNRYDIDEKDNLRARQIYTQVGVVENIILAVVVLATLSFMLMSFESVRQIGTGIMASAGVVGIVIGFAAQKTLGNFIAGIQIALAQPIRLDDVVIVENEWGWIEEITLTYVVVRIWDLRRLIVPISYFVEKPFQNWTRVSADILGSVYIYADYTVSVPELRKEFSRILRESTHWDKKVDALQVTDTTDRAVEIRALMSAATSPEVWSLRCEVREKLLEFLQKHQAQALPRCRIELDRDANPMNKTV